MTQITLLDGSIGQELVKRRPEKPTPLWSTQVMMNAPDLVGQVHTEYVAAGAKVLSTNTYTVHRARLERVGLEDQMAHLLDTALIQAEVSRAPGVRIAGCLGPLMASYRPDLEPELDLAETRFAEIAKAMQGRVDLLLIETVSSCHEAEGALRGAAHTDLPVWIAFTVDDSDGTHLRSGEPLSDALALCKSRVAAVMANCSRPEAITEAMPVLAKSGLPFGGYANGFTKITDGFKKDAPTVDALQARQDLSPEAYARFAVDWADFGATIIGGCCEVGPTHIAETARRLTANGHVLI
ncbi:MAG: homocysteine S-methyltransferase family protein [Aliishimia sp.]